MNSLLSRVSQASIKVRRIRLFDALVLVLPWATAVAFIDYRSVFSLFGLAVMLLTLLVNKPGIAARYAISAMGLAVIVGAFISIPLAVLSACLVAYVFDVDLLSTHQVEFSSSDPILWDDRINTDTFNPGSAFNSEDGTDGLVFGSRNHFPS